MNNIVISLKDIASKIYLIRGKNVMIDMDLAILYEVDNKVLKRAVKRHIERFPEDFMFILTRNEFISLRCQFGTLKTGRGQHSKYLPMAFTEQGIAMLSSILNSKCAIQVNIQIIRAFIQLRSFILSNKDLKKRIDELEKTYNQQFKIVFEAIRQLLDTPKPKKEFKIGFRVL